MHLKFELRTLWQSIAALGIAACALAPGPLRAADGEAPVDLGNTVPDVARLSEGLFPLLETQCEAVEATKVFQGCMGFKPAPVRFSLPSANFRSGSAELPELLRTQLDKFAEVLRAKKGSGKVIRIEGHADATGTSDINQVLSLQRAQAARAYLVKHGVEPGMLHAVGMGSDSPKLPGDPKAAENRRIEIAREMAR